ncbi:MAG: hypothetical protein ACM3JD_05880 [Rudaea sp.]
MATQQSRLFLPVLTVTAIDARLACGLFSTAQSFDPALALTDNPHPTTRSANPASP